MTDEPATRTLTYRELSDALGISLRAAEARARRRVRQGQWRPLKTNDGVARFVVPVAEMEAERVPTAGATKAPTHGTTEGDTHPHGSNKLLIGLQATLSRLTEQSAAELREARAQIEQRAAELAELRERLARAETRADLTEVARGAAEIARKTAEAERDVLSAELSYWTGGSPLARALRALFYRRAR